MRGKQDGFTLIEALVAVAILGIVVAAVTSMLPSLASTNARTTQEQRATLAAKAYFESVRANMQVNFDMDPTTLEVPGTGNGLTCTKSSPTNLDVIKGVVVLKRVALSCTVRDKVYPFALDVARPL